jgi:hypothetical protein
MLSANEAKLIAFRNKMRGLFHNVESLIEEAALKGETMCSVKLEDSPGSTIGMLYEISHLLFELGYQTAIEYSTKTLTIYWNPKVHYYNMSDAVEEEDMFEDDEHTYL